MQRLLIACLAMALGASPLAAQQSVREAIAQGQLNTLMQAQQILAAAESAGASIYAPSLYADAEMRLRFAQENWNANRRETREAARLRADQAVWAGRAALAKAQWLGANAAVRILMSDITRFGGRTDVVLVDEEAPDAPMPRGANSRERINIAQAWIDRARAAGAESIPGNDLGPARENLETARKITRADSQSESADHLAYVAEMIARRAYYLARAAETNRYYPTVQAERTRLAQAQAEAQAAAERARREEAERRAMEIQQQLAAEAANRQMQAEELDRLRQQVEMNRRLLEEQVERDRVARLEAQRQLDEAVRRYEAALASGSSAEVENLRRQVEDQQIALRAIQERERLNEQSLSSQIDNLRRELDMARQQGTTSAQLLSEREAELRRREEEYQRLRREREEDMNRRMELDRQQQSTIAEAQRRRQEAEAQAQALQQQVQQVQQQAQQTQAELERARQAARQTQEELEQARRDLAAREAETRRMRMQTELARLAATRSDARGLIVTLPGIFFDTGKSELKPGARSTLTKIAEQLSTDSTVRIEVEGHTDSVGSESSNQALSERRAAAVRDFLVNAGIPSARIDAEGMGESQPVATNNTASGRQQNRRVELIITNE